MPEVIISGPEGRLEGRYQPARDPTAPLGLVLHPHPQHGGTMNNKVVYTTYRTFVQRGYGVLRFNFRGVGRSMGSYDRGEGELSDAAAALDWLQSVAPTARSCWVAGFSFGAWIGMQVLMRRPEIAGFIAISPPADRYDFTFLAPCPASGIMVIGDKDEIVPVDAVRQLVEKLRKQRDIGIDLKILAGANHYYTGLLEELSGTINAYLDTRDDA